jgi:hypothetical protein
MRESGTSRKVARGPAARPARDLVNGGAIRATKRALQVFEEIQPAGLHLTDFVVILEL